MKYIPRFLLCALALIAPATHAAPVATTAGSNLTAYNSGMGADNNAMWNSYMNPRSSGAAASAPTANFGNCNALILRCAQPKCANGGCATMEIARPIVSGCVLANETCAQYGNELIEYISAQLVSDATAAAQAATANAQVAAAQAAAQQSNQQMAAMQQQMQQMQQQMQQQSADTAAQLQAAIDSMTAAQTAAANAASAPATTTSAATSVSSGTTGGALSTGAVNLSAAQQVAAQSGVSAELLAREQIAGQVLTSVENAEVALRSAAAAMNTVFEYAGCDSTGSNCAGPERVKVFKQKAMEFFDPYNDVLDELYDALILAQSVGIDITDIYMMLNGTCNVWGQYLCDRGQVMHYTQNNCPNGKSVPYVQDGGGTVRGGADCEIGQVVPMSDGGCQLIKMLTDEDEVQRNWLYHEKGNDGAQVRIGCASEALDNSALFRNRRKQASIDIEVLQRMIEQDAPVSYGVGGTTLNSNRTVLEDGLPYCQLNDKTYQDLQKIATLKTLPDKVCVNEGEMKRIAKDGTPISDTNDEAVNAMYANCRHLGGLEWKRCLCEQRKGSPQYWAHGVCVCADMGDGNDEFDYGTLTCVPAGQAAHTDPSTVNMPDTLNDVNLSYSMQFCNDFAEDGAVWDTALGMCNCSGIPDANTRTACEYYTEYEIKY